MANPGACILGVEGHRLGPDEAAFLREADPFGLILFARNIDTPDQVRRLTGDLRAALGRQAPILIDQEGGRVQRMGPPHWRQWVPPLDEGAGLPDERRTRAIWLRYRLIAAELAASGIDADCAPSGDIATEGTHPFLKNRCFGTGPATVIPAMRAAADGLLAGGVLPVMKHMPGHGRAQVDSHLTPPIVTEPLDLLDATDFATFRALSDMPMGMTGHVVLTALDPERPATQSPIVIAAIRDRIGFDGLLMTDDLGMQALAGTPYDRAGRAIAAGCDIALHCNGNRAELAQSVEAAGRLTPAGQARADRALAHRRPPEPVDLAALIAEFEGLTA